MLAMEQTETKIIAWGDAVVRTTLSLALSVTVLECQFEEEVIVLEGSHPLWKVVCQQNHGRKWTYEIVAILIEEKLVICPYMSLKLKPELLEQMVNNALYAAIPISVS